MSNYFIKPIEGRWSDLDPNFHVRHSIKLGDIVTIDLQLLKSRLDHSKWTIEHIITRNSELAATLIIDGAWIDTLTLKLTKPPELVCDTFERMPRAENFE